MPDNNLPGAEIASISSAYSVAEILIQVVRDSTTNIIGLKTTNTHDKDSFFTIFTFVFYAIG